MKLPDDTEVFFAGSVSNATPGLKTLDLETETRLESSPTKSLPELPLPTSLGSYRIDGEIARGGMGVVLRGHHEALARDVAIKLLLPKARADNDSQERFFLEAQATARLRHPGIVAIHDVARDPQGNPYLVMDFIEGKTLRQHLRDRGVLAPREAAVILEAVALAVHHAHEHGILHRDLKPDNVILDSAGNPHLTDFGLAKVVDFGAESEAPAPTAGDGVSQTALTVAAERAARTSDNPTGELIGGRRTTATLAVDLTSEGAIMGTPRYMAPEQVCGKELKQTADVWALGAMLWPRSVGIEPGAASASESWVSSGSHLSRPTQLARSSASRGRPRWARPPPCSTWLESSWLEKSSNQTLKRATPG